MKSEEATQKLVDVLYKARWVDGIKDQTLTIVSDAGIAKAIREAGFVHIEEEIV